MKCFTSAKYSNASSKYCIQVPKCLSRACGRLEFVCSECISSSILIASKLQRFKKARKAKLNVNLAQSECNLAADLTFPVARLIYSVTFCDKVVSLSHLSHFDICIKAVLNTFFLPIPSFLPIPPFLLIG